MTAQANPPILGRHHQLEDGLGYRRLVERALPVAGVVGKRADVDETTVVKIDTPHGATLAIGEGGPSPVPDRIAFGVMNAGTRLVADGSDAAGQGALVAVGSVLGALRLNHWLSIGVGVDGGKDRLTPDVEVQPHPVLLESLLKRVIRAHRRST